MKGMTIDMKKRLLSVALTLCMLFCLLPNTAQAFVRDDIFAFGAVLQVGDTHQLEIIRQPADLEGTVRYISHDKNIVTVDSNGLVTAVAEGETEILCKIDDGVSESVPIIVGGSPPKASITLDQTDIKVSVGADVYLTPTLTGIPKNAMVSLISTNSAVAEFSGGKTLLSIKGISPGTATVYMRAGFALASCKVEVGYFTPTAVVLTADEVPVGTDFQLKPTFVPATASGELIYSSSDPAVATVSDTGFVTTLAAGSTTITAVVKGVRVKTTCKVVVLPSTVVSTTITPPTKKNYSIGQSLDMTGGKIVLKNSDGSKSTVALKEYMVTGYDKYTAGKQELTITYGKTSIPYHITVTEKKVKGIKISAPYKVNYNYGEDLIVSDGRIEVSYEDYTKELIVLTESMVTGYDKYKSGKQTLTITYEGTTKTYLVFVAEKPEVPVAPPVETPTEPPVPSEPPKPADPFVGFDAVAEPSVTKLTVNGKAVAVDAYLINQNNYIKLRDLAMMISGTPKNFNVGWDGAKNAINLTAYTPYTPVGGEMVAGDGQKKGANLGTSAVLLMGNELDLTAYLIGQNNYFKLRDVMEYFNVYVGWDQQSGTASLDTSKSYEAE